MESAFIKLRIIFQILDPYYACTVQQNDIIACHST